MRSRCGLLLFGSQPAAWWASPSPGARGKAWSVEILRSAGKRAGLPGGERGDSLRPQRTLTAGPGLRLSGLAPGGERGP